MVKYMLRKTLILNNSFTGLHQSFSIFPLLYSAEQTQPEYVTFSLAFSLAFSQYVQYHK